jgi:hypothetical protein
MEARRLRIQRRCESIRRGARRRPAQVPTASTVEQSRAPRSSTVRPYAVPSPT